MKEPDGVTSAEGWPRGVLLGESGFVTSLSRRRLVRTRASVEDAAIVLRLAITLDTTLHGDGGRVWENIKKQSLRVFLGADKTGQPSSSLSLMACVITCTNSIVVQESVQRQPGP